ncbi:MAG: CHAT domain-containing protein [Salinivirgaceae bacterium]|nr:CHAT domain-containing protein [Salinivirgaceae bacterium]
MKQIIASFILLLTLTQNSNSQNITADTTLAKEFLVKVTDYNKSRLYDSAAVFCHKAALVYSKYSLWEDYLFCENQRGVSISHAGNYNEAIRIIENAIDTSILFLESNSLNLATTYNSLGIRYKRKSDYNKALDYYKLSLDIRLNRLGENNLDVAGSYFCIGLLFRAQLDMNKALEYYMKTLQIYNDLLPEIHVSKLQLNEMIGELYRYRGDYSRALECHSECLSIGKSIYGDEDIKMIPLLHNVGVSYKGMKKYEKALECYLKAIEINKKFYIVDNLDKAQTYGHLGLLYQEMEQYDLALEYQIKSLKINKKILGENTMRVSANYFYTASSHAKKEEFNLAAVYFRKSIYANLNISYDSTCRYCQPAIGKSINKALLIDALGNLVRLYSDSSAFLPSLENQHFILKLCQMADTVINQTRKLTIDQSDKIVLGSNAAIVYAGAMNICLQLDSLNLAFEFSEKNKAMVLQASMAHVNALQFAGIPDSLLQQEKDLQQNIALYTQKLAVKPDSAQEVFFRDKLFTANRNYEKLIEHFEADYKEYYTIKYDNKMVTVEEIQSSLDDKTSMISYFTTDNVIYVSSISKNSFKLIKVDKPGNFEKQIALFQKAILTQNEKIYTNYGEKLYKTLFPENSIAQNIENLVLIPDGALTTIPFEALLNNNKEYLIKDYNISYAYSANLWYQKKNKPAKTYDYDFLAFAPVFADGSTAGTTLRTRSMFAEMDSLAYATDSVATRGRMLNGEQITALPATETEVTDIFNLYKKRHKKALVKTHAQANEPFAKSDTLSNSRIIHIATHGFVNEEKPELSGLLLAQDSTLSDDGILYSGEIYNLNLNANLVVLSACETGLGQIKQGEGVMGLTRALMYAGADNIMVSLWKVSDESTGQLMVDFYTKMLKDKKNKKSYSQLLRKAKLEMIDGGTYSHPYYWSPFVLIGE